MIHSRFDNLLKKIGDTKLAKYKKIMTVDKLPEPDIIECSFAFLLIR